MSQIPEAPGEPDALLRVEAIDNPFPGASLGDIGRAVRVDVPPSLDERPFHLISVAYETEDLGWVDPAGLRLVSVDLTSGRFHLVPDSWPDPENRTVSGHVERSGVYALVGYPVAGPVLDAWLLMRERAMTDAELASGWHHPICERIMCRADGPLGDPPRGVRRLIDEGGLAPPLPGLPPLLQHPKTICDACLGVINPVIEDFPVPPWTSPRPPWPGTGLPVTSELVAAATFLNGQPTGAPSAGRDTYLEVIDYQTWQQVDLIHVPDTRAIDFAMTDTHFALIGNGQADLVLIDRAAGNAQQTFNVGFPGRFVSFSRDEKTVWVTGGNDIAGVDVASGTVAQRIKVPALPGGSYPGCAALAMSPDGRTLATIVAGTSTLVLADTASLKTATMTLGAGPATTLGFGLAFVGNSRLGVWRATPPVPTFYLVDIVTRTVLRSYAVQWVTGPTVFPPRIATYGHACFSGTSDWVNGVQHHGLLTFSAMSMGSGPTWGALNIQQQTASPAYLPRAGTVAFASRSPASPVPAPPVFTVIGCDPITGNLVSIGPLPFGYELFQGIAGITDFPPVLKTA